MLGDWTALPVGIVIATLASMVGLGGGILWTPYLIFVARIEPGGAVLMSLIIQIAGMGSGGLSSIIRGKTDLRFALILALLAFPGVAIGVWLSRIIDPGSLVFLLGVACLATALIFVFAREEYTFKPSEEIGFRAFMPYAWIPSLFSILTGLLSVGVGDFLVPILRNRLNMRMDTAIGACLIVMSINAASASVLRITWGQTIPSRLIFWAILGVLIGGQIGPRLADKVPDQTLKEIFIYGLSLVGIHILFNVW